MLYWLRFLPAILAGLVAGTTDQDIEGSGMFLGKRDHTYQIQHAGEGLLNKAVPHGKIRGFYVKHDDQIYQGQGILHGLFGKNAFIESFILIVIARKKIIVKL